MGGGGSPPRHAWLVQRFLVASLKKTITGWAVSYECPHCQASLTSSVNSIGDPDECPDCSQGFVVPGGEEWTAKQLEIEHDKVNKQAKKARKEQRRIYQAEREEQERRAKARETLQDLADERTNEEFEFFRGLAANALPVKPADHGSAHAVTAIGVFAIIVGVLACTVSFAIGLPLGVLGLMICAVGEIVRQLGNIEHQLRIANARDSLAHKLSFKRQGSSAPSMNHTGPRTPGVSQ